MRQDYGKYQGRQVADHDTAFYGLVDGDLVVLNGCRLDLYGLVTGDLIVDEGGMANVYGTVKGGLFNKGGQAQIYGIIGSVTGHNGTTIHPKAIVIA